MAALCGLFYGLKKMANTDIKWFSFDNTNAPQLSNTWGCMIDVLDACLVTGFGSQLVSSIVIEDGVGVATFGGLHNFKQFQVVEISGANEAALNSEFKILGLTANTIEFLIDLPNQVATGMISCKLASLGWTKAFSGSQKAVYQAKDKAANPFFLRVDNSRDPVYTDSYAKFAKVGMLDACTGIDDLTGNQAPFDPLNPNKNWVGTGSGSTAIAGWFKWQYAVNESSADSASWFESEGATNGMRHWVLVGNDHCFYLVNKTTVATALEVPYGFGTVIHEGSPKPFLFGVNRYATADTTVLTATALGDFSRVDVAALYNHSGALDNKRLHRLYGAFNNAPSGTSKNVIKIDLERGYILTPV